MDQVTTTLTLLFGSGVEYPLWYASLLKPAFAPPPWVFGVVWGSLYPLIALAALASLYLFFKQRLNGFFLVVFLLNLVANFLFTPIQLLTHNNVLASIDILIVLGTLVYLEWVAFKNAKLVFLLLLPYLLWGAFATVLLLSITVLNW